MHIGKVEIKGKAALAPMAGFTDRAFREICKSYGAAYVVSEMVSCKGLVMGNEKTRALIDIAGERRPVAVQLFGHEPDDMAQAAALCMEYSPDVIDINMGCPTPKIVGNKAGAALMLDMPLAGRIIRHVVRASRVPVTVKIRKGWDDKSVNAVEFSKMAEAAGAAAIVVHGRTRQQMYHSQVDLDIIGQVKRAVSIPVIGNGDIKSAKDALFMLNETGCDLVMVGRAALGRPWIFSQINAFLKDGTVLPEPSLQQRMEVMLKHIRKMCEYKGEALAMREARSHAAFYIKGIRGASRFRQMCGRLCSFSDLEKLAQLVVEHSEL